MAGPCYFNVFTQTTWIAFLLSDITVDENAWILILRPILSEAAAPKESVLQNCVNLSRSRCRLFAQYDSGMRPVSRKSQAAWVLRHRPPNSLVFSKQDEGAMECIQVQILVEQLSYGKIFTPGKAGIFAPQTARSTQLDAICWVFE